MKRPCWRLIRIRGESAENANREGWGAGALLRTNRLGFMLTRESVLTSQRRIDREMLKIQCVDQKVLGNETTLKYSIKWMEKVAALRLTPKSAGLSSRKPPHLLLSVKVDVL